MSEFRLPRLPRTVPIVETSRVPSMQFQQWWQSVVEKLEAQEGSQDDLIQALADAVAAIQAAQTAADAATVAAETAQATAEAAQAAADAAQATADAIVVPPSGSRTVTANSNFLVTDSTLLVDATAGPVTITLPSAGAYGTEATIKKIDASANAVTIAVQPGDTINGGPSISLPAQYDEATCVTDGADWFA